MDPMAAATSLSDVTPYLLAILSGLGLFGGIGLGIKALLERRSLNATALATQAKAGGEDATAASIVAAAARELIDPLRKELATEREEHREERKAERAEADLELERERAKVRALQADLDKALDDVALLRSNLRKALVEVGRAKETVLQKDREILALEQEIARCKAESRKNDGLASGPHTP